VIANLLCFFVAGLEFVSESFVSGVDLGDSSSVLGAVVEEVARNEDVGNGTTKKGD
jgi:phosphatidylinositol glycan class N